MADKAATALVFFVIAIVAFGLSACFAAVTYGMVQDAAISNSNNSDTGDNISIDNSSSANENYGSSDNQQSYNAYSNNNTKSMDSSNVQSTNSSTNTSDFITSMGDSLKGLLGISSNNNQYSSDSSLSNDIINGDTASNIASNSQQQSTQNLYDQIMNKLNNFL